MRLTPHPHGCPECSCVWECENPHCTDHEGQWCKNFCSTCAQPPVYLRQIAALETAGHLIHRAAAILEQGAGETELASLVDAGRTAILAKVQEKGRGVMLGKALGTRAQDPV